MNVRLTVLDVTGLFYIDWLRQQQYVAIEGQLI